MLCFNHFNSAINTRLYAALTASYLSVIFRGPVSFGDVMDDIVHITKATLIPF